MPQCLLRNENEGFVWIWAVPRLQYMNLRIDSLRAMRHRLVQRWPRAYTASCNENLHSADRICGRQFILKNSVLPQLLNFPPLFPILSKINLKIAPNRSIIRLLACRNARKSQLFSVIFVGVLARTRARNLLYIRTQHYCYTNLLTPPAMLFIEDQFKIISCRLGLGLPRSQLPFDFPTTTLCIHFLSSVYKAPPPNTLFFIS